MRYFARRGRILLAGLFPGDPTSHDVVVKDTKTYKKFLERKPSDETGLDRLKEMFKIDEFGNISPELNSVYQAGFLGFLVGVLYGGFIHSREAYFRFMENNQATAFKSHLAAKRKLQDEFTVNFAKGGFRWGWRLALFTSSYYGIVTCVSVYREKSSIYEYLAAGTITGAMFKVNMGLRGITAGGIIGGALGGVAGVVSLLLLRISGNSMEEVRYWQYKWRQNREEDIRTVNKMEFDRIDNTPEIIVQRDLKPGTKTSLEDVK